jgi:tetratricopeptide (TPR) repeat protein
VARLSGASVTAAGVMLGTANYMSPEQVVGGPLDARSDLFSVGSLLCELALGRRPFEGDSTLGTLYKIAYEEPSFAPAGPECEDLLPVLKRSLARKADERHPTAADLAAELRTFLKNRRGAPPDEDVASRPARGSSPGFAPSFVVADGPGTSRPMDPACGAPPTIEVARPGADPGALFKLIRDIHVDGKSGDLHMTHDSERRSLRILRGQIINGSCDLPGEHLGDVLIRYGFLSQADLDPAIEMVLRERRPLGSVLTELGLLGRGRVEEAVTLHVREILFNALERAHGSLRFEEVPDAALMTEIASRLSTGDLILEATRRVHDPAFIREALGDLDGILELTRNPLLRAQQIMLTPADGFILSRIDGQLSAREILGLIPLPSEEAERSLFGLICTGTVDYRLGAARCRSSQLGGVGGGVPARAAAALPTTRPSPLLGATNDALPVPPAAPSDEEAARRQGIIAAHEGLSDKDHFQVLGLTCSATEGEVREAHARLVRLLHPDACRGSAFSDLREQIQALFFRVCEAYETLRSAVPRAAYERKIAARKGGRPWTSVAGTPFGQASPPPHTTERTAAASPPVRQPRPDPANDAAMAIDLGDSVRSGECLVGEQRYWDAIQHLEKLIPLTRGLLRHRASVALARAYSKNPKWAKRADDILQSVVHERPDFVPAYLALGALYRAGNFVNRARAMYRRALELDPTQAEARAELASLEGERSRRGRGRG